MFDKSWLRILADTRVADSVIRLTANEGDYIRQSGYLTPTYVHEWMHYFQFSVTPIGILMSRYRRECFLVLRNYFSTDRTSSPDDFIEKLASFKENWQEWPSDWHVIGDTRSREVSRVTLRPDGLRVQLKGLSVTFSLPVGVQALFEGWAWCAEQTYSFAKTSALEIPKSPELLKYTWPLWVLADILGKDIDSVDEIDLAGVAPILLIASFYDASVLSCEGLGVPSSFGSAVDDMQQRNVTLMRLLWQLFRDYHKFWSVRPSLRNTDAYLEKIGLPALSLMLKLTSDLLQETLRVCRDELETEQQEYSARGLTVMNDDSLVEYDILNVSHQNLMIAARDFDNVLTSPYMIAQRMAPPVCAIEAPDGYEWCAIGFGKQSDTHWKGQTGSRIILREQLSITEHIMIQRAFGDHLACYGSPDWKIPINQCPHALPCMSLTTRRGIEFCVDSAWRQKVAYVLQAAANAEGTDLSDDIVPGIISAAHELAERLSAPATENDLLDLQRVEMGWLIEAMRANKNEND